MVKIIFASAMEQYTRGEKEIRINVTTYRQACELLMREFPLLNKETLSEFSVAIDDEIIHEPLLESFELNSVVFFVPKIAAG
ncbi:MAG: hypothetical protein KUG82_14405 [Pseudomonadales bacterium]|nr:hypothetical protein [Pseudomonadales bacterium]